MTREEVEAALVAPDPAPDPHAAAMAAGLGAVEKALERTAKANHTPGPWVEEAEGEIVGADGTCVCDLIRNHEDPQVRADLALICAAPELADALEAAQWGDHSPAGFVQCPTCQRKQKRGHAPGCAIGNALRKAGR